MDDLPRTCEAFDCSAGASCQCRNIINKDSCHSRKSNRHNRSNGGWQKPSISAARGLFVFPRASCFFRFGKSRSSSTCMLKSQSTHNTPVQQPQDLPRQQQHDPTLHQRCSSSSLELDASSSHLERGCPSREPQPAPDSSTSQKSQQVHCTAADRFCGAATPAPQGRTQSKRECGGGWRSAAPEVLSDFDSFSRPAEKNVSDVVTFPVCSCGTKVSSERFLEKAETTGSLDLECGWRKDEAEQRTAAISGNSEEGESFAVKMKGGGEDQVSRMPLHEKLEEHHSAGVAPPDSAEQIDTSVASPATPFLSLSTICRFPFSRQAAITPHSSRAFSRTASTVAENQGSILSATAPAAMQMHSASRPQAIRKESSSYGEDAAANISAQVLLKPSVILPTELASVYGPSGNTCLLSFHAGAHRSTQQKATRIEAGLGARASAPSAAKAEKERGETLLQREGSELSVEGKRQSGLASAEIEKRSGADWSEGEHRIGSEAVGGGTRSYRTQTRTAPEHHDKYRHSHQQRRKRSPKHFFSRGSKEMEVPHKVQHCDTLRMNRRIHATCSNECAKTGRLTVSNTATCNGSKTSCEAGNVRAMRKRAATLLALLRRNSFRDVHAGERPVAESTMKETEESRTSGESEWGNKSAGKKGEGGHSGIGTQRSDLVDTYGLIHGLDNSNYATYLQWHEDKWGEKVFDQIEVADVDILNYPLRRGLGCIIM